MFTIRGDDGRTVMVDQALIQFRIEPKEYFRGGSTVGPFVYLDVLDDAGEAIRREQFTGDAANQIIRELNVMASHVDRLALTRKDEAA